MKYLKRFNEELYIEDEEKTKWFDDSVINNIETILIELKDNDIPVNIKTSDKEIVIDFGDPNPRAFNRYTLPTDKFEENGKIKEYINESLKTLIDYINETEFFIYIYLSHNNGAGPKSINYLIDATWREFAYIKSLRIVISKNKVNIY